MSASGRERRWLDQRADWPLLLILATALLLRCWSLDWQLPDLLLDDELKYAEAASLSAAGLDGRSLDYRNPPLFRHLLDLEYRALPLLGQHQPSSILDLDSARLARRVVIGRWNVALLGTASVGLLYLVGQQLGGRGTGLLAAALLAVNFLSVYLDHASLNDGPAAFFLIAALLPTTRLLSQPTRRGYLLAGFFAGLATACKYNSGVVLAAPLAVWTLGLTDRARPGRALLPSLAALGGGYLAGLLIGMPELLWASGQIRAGLAQQAELGNHRWIGQTSDPTPLLYLLALLQASGLPALLAALLGAVRLWTGRGGLAGRRPGWILLTLLAAPVVYLVVMLGKSLFFARFALPLVPFVCLIAAVGLDWLWRTGWTRRTRVTILAAACCAALAPPAWLSIRLDLLASQADTRVEARRWIQGNIRPGSRLVVQEYALPHIRAGDPLWRAYNLDDFYRPSAIIRPDRSAEPDCSGRRYVLLSSFQTLRQVNFEPGSDPADYRALRERARLLKTFWPGPDETSVPLNVDDDALPFWHLTSYARPVSTIQLYELDPGVC